MNIDILILSYLANKKRLGHYCLVPISVILAVLWANSCGNSTCQRLQAKAVPVESVHKKLHTKIGTIPVASCRIVSR